MYKEVKMIEIELLFRGLAIIGGIGLLSVISWEIRKWWKNKSLRNE